MKSGWALVGICGVGVAVVLLDRPSAPAPVHEPFSVPSTVPLPWESATSHSEAYQQPALPAAVYRPPVFHAYECTEDCSGHEAGYAWAERHDIDDPDDCGGNSQSFIEGCQAYAEEQREEPKEDEHADEESDD